MTLVVHSPPDPSIIGKRVDLLSKVLKPRIRHVQQHGAGIRVLPDESRVCFGAVELFSSEVRLRGSMNGDNLSRC